MTYRELLALYKAGELDESRRRAVEADIERQDAIGEYLYEEAEIPGLEALGGEPNPGGEGGGELSGLIRRAIRRAFVKMGIIVGAAVLALALGAVFLLPRLVSLFYYDPTAVVGRSEYGGMATRQMDLDMAVYSELFLPGRYRDCVNAEAEGWGVYNITIPQTMTYNDRFTAVSGRLVRGKLTLYDTNTLRLPTGNAFRLPDGVQGGTWNAVDGVTGEYIGPAGTTAEAREKLETLDDREWVLGFVSLAEVTDYEDFMAWFDEKELIYGSLWCAVYAEDEFGCILGENIGFIPRPAGQELAWDRERYPLLSLLSGEGRAQEDRSATAMTTHFLSLLRYMDDHSAFRQMLGGSGPSDFREMAESVERDGLRLYGFAIGARPEALRALSRDPAVSYIYTSPLNG